jgi:hypothetical protein
MILENGKQNILKLLAGDTAGKKITQIVVGTSSTPATTADTTITNPVAVNVSTIEYLAGDIERYTASLGASVPAMTIAEMGLLNEAGVLMHRKVLAPTFSKSAGLAYTLKYEIKVI